MGIIMSGLDYQKAPIALREQLSFTKTQAGALTGRLAQGEGILGCVLLSTCNRTELYLSCPPEGRAAPDRLLCRAVGLDPGPFAGAFVTRRGEEAVRHLMEVAGGLQSQIWGEDQILSQVKGAIAIAREQGAADPVLETLFRTAVSAGKEIKTKVRLTGVAVSAAARAVEVLQRDLGDLRGRRALVIGNGEMGRLSAALLREAGCAVTPYGERYASMEGMDILLSATTSPHYTVSARQMSMLKARPSWVVDLAMPRDVDPAAGDLPGVTLYNVDTLGAEQRRGALPQTVTDILDSHMARFYEWSNYRRCLPAIEALKEAIAQRVLTYPELEEDLEAEELVELAVSRAVDLLTGGLKERIRPEDLERCAGKIRVHTAARGQREGRHAHIPFSHVC